MKKLGYSLAILRLCNHYGLDEFVNVGIAMYIFEKHQLLFRIRHETDRLERFFKDFDSISYKEMAVRLEETYDIFCEGTLNSLEMENIGVEVFDHFIHWSGRLHWSPLRSGISDDPKKRFEQVYHGYVLSNC